MGQEFFKSFLINKHRTLTWVEIMFEQKRNSITFTPIAIGVVGFLAALFLSSTDFDHKGYWTRSFLQVCIVGVCGYLVSTVLERYKDSLQRERNTKNLQMDVQKQLSQSYMEVKLIRRQMQPSKTYDENKTSNINTLQVDFELHKRTSTIIFKNGKALQSKLRAMEKYLNRVANKPDSDERSGFLGYGFRYFADLYTEANEIMTEEIVSD